MNYEVGGKVVFETFGEAVEFANWYAKETRVILCIAETKKKATHIWREAV